VRGSAVVAGVLLAIAGGLGLYSRHVWEEQQVAIAVTKLEREGAETLELTKKRPLEGLLRAMRSGENIQQLMQQKPTSEYLTSSPVYALQQALEPTKYQTLLAHPAAIIQMVVTPKGDRIITLSTDHLVRTWDLSGKLIHSFKLLNQLRAQSGKISDNGDIIATATEKGKIEIFKTSGQLIGRIDSTGINIEAYLGSDIIFIDSNEDQIFLTERSIETSEATTFILERSGKMIGKFPGVEVSSLSKKNQFLTIDANNAQLRDLSGKIISNFTGHSDSVLTAKFDAEGNRVLSSSADQTGKIWDLSGHLIRSFKGFQGRVSDIDINNIGNRVVTENRNPSPYLWDMSGNLISKLEGHTNIAFSRFSRDGMHIVTGSGDGTARVWDLSGKLLSEFTGHLAGQDVSSSLQDAIFLPDGDRVVTRAQDNTIRIWNWRSLAESTQREPLSSVRFFSSEEGSSNFDYVFMQPNGSRILLGHQCYYDALSQTIGSSDECRKKAQIYDFSGKKLSTIILPKPPKKDGMFWGQYRTQTLSWLISNSGKYIIARSNYDGQAEELFIFDWHGNKIEGRRVIAITKNLQFGLEHSGSLTLRNYPETGKVDLLDSSGKLVRRIPVNSYTKFSPSGQNLVTSSDRKTTLLTLSGKKMAEMRGHSPSFNFKNNRILTIDDNAIKVWNFSGRLLSQYQLKNDVADVGFAPHDDVITMIFRDGKVQSQPIETLPQMLDRGCTWLRTYLAANPTELDQLPTCKAQISQTRP
jgi:WD40 repeat protein